MSSNATIERGGGEYRNEYVSQHIIYVADTIIHFDYKYDIRVNELTWS